MITSIQLFTAADTIASAASVVSRLAMQTPSEPLRDLRRQFAGQLANNARQVLSWARSARSVEDRGEPLPRNTAYRIEAATREFLAQVEG